MVMNQLTDSPGVRSRIVIVGAAMPATNARGTWNAGCRARPRRS